MCTCREAGCALDRCTVTQTQGFQKERKRVYTIIGSCDKSLLLKVGKEQTMQRKREGYTVHWNPPYASEISVQYFIICFVTCFSMLDAQR